MVTYENEYTFHADLTGHFLYFLFSLPFYITISSDKCINVHIHSHTYSLSVK